MDSLLTLGISLAGFFVGTLAFSRVGHWLLGIRTVLKNRGQASFAVRLSIAAFVAAGPWLVIALAAFAYNVYGHAWSYWFFGGVLVSISFFSGLSLYFAQKKRMAVR